MLIQEIPIGKIKPAAYNPRKDLKPTDPAYQKLKKALDQFDIVEPLVWNKRTGNLVGGHQRFKILRERGDKSITVSVVDLDEHAEKVLNLALNKQGGEWDYATLADMLTELDAGDIDMELTGFDASELEKLMTWAPPGTIAACGVIGDLEYRVVIECANEQEQSTLLDRFEQEGLRCKALTS